MKTDKLKLKLLAIMLVVAVGVSVSSCDDEEYYFSDLVGSWQLVESGGQPVYDYQVDYYTFYSDGTGCYSYYDRRGHLWDEPFLWDIRSGGRLYLSYEIRNTATRCVIIAMTDAICISPRVRRSTTTRCMPRRAEDFQRRGQ